MKYVVSLNPNVDFDPPSEVREILQNVRTILSTRKGSVPLDRDYGLTWDHVDKPIQTAQMLMRSEIVDEIERYEPRAKVVSIEFDENIEGVMDGLLQPRVTVSIGGEDE